MSRFRRTISFPESMLRDTKFPGRTKVFSVLVGWPELELTEQQHLENSLDRLNGVVERHCPSGLIMIEVTND